MSSSIGGNHRQRGPVISMARIRHEVGQWVSRGIQDRHKATQAVLAALALALAAPATATEIYRWVDDQGKTHFSDIVPEKYKDRATPVQAKTNEPSPEERSRASERAGKANADTGAASTASTARGASTARPAASATSATKRPPRAPSEDTDCETWRRLYRESLDCFAPYRTVRGTTKAEAFEHCNPVVEPPIRCGRVSTSP
jgi:Domain of unknown function (DUF4124)